MLYERMCFSHNKCLTYVLPFNLGGWAGLGGVFLWGSLNGWVLSSRLAGWGRRRWWRSFSFSWIWGCWGIGCLPWEYKSRIWWQMSKENKVKGREMTNEVTVNLDVIYKHRKTFKKNISVCLISFGAEYLYMWCNLLPSSSSTGTSCTNCSHHRRDDCLDVHSWMSNLQRRPARYMTATAMISGSHCSDSIVQRLLAHENKMIINGKKHTLAVLHSFEAY